MNPRSTLLSAFFVLSGCSMTVIKDSGPSRFIDFSEIANAVPINEPLSDRGNPASYVVFGQRYFVLGSAENFKEKGIASWYGNKFHGNQTSNGEIYDMYAMTAAHKRLPLPSYVRVTNLNNHKSVIVRVNDRGPFHQGRIIDLSYVAASKLGIDKTGTAPVEIAVVTSEQLTPVLAENVPEGKIALQVGAFSLRENAEKMRDELRLLLDMPVGIGEVYKNGQKLFRVRLGPFDDISSAKQWNEKLKKLSFNQVSLVYLSN